MEQIATQLGVSHMTVARDLADFNTMLKSNRAKTESNPKGSGRRKGSKASRPAYVPKSRDLKDREKEIVELSDEGLAAADIAVKVGIGGRTVHRVLKEESIRRSAEEKVDPSTLSASAQKKLEAAIRQEVRKLQQSYYQEMNEKIQKQLLDTILPRYRKEQEMAKRVMERRRGIMDKTTFNKIRRCLHPDSRNSVSDEMLAEGFDAFMDLKSLLLSEKDSPTDFMPLPRTAAEWEEAKRAATAARKARRSNGHSEVRPR